jgi:cytoskeletal protein RodZ
MEKKNHFGKFNEFLKNNRFNLISWSVTVLIVAALAGFGFWWVEVGSAAPTAPEATPAASNTSQSPPASNTVTNKVLSSFTIGRGIELKTDISQQGNSSHPIPSCVGRLAVCHRQAIQHQTGNDFIQQ